MVCVNSSSSWSIDDEHTRLARCQPVDDRTEGSRRAHERSGEVGNLGAGDAAERRCELIERLSSGNHLGDEPSLGGRQSPRPQALAANPAMTADDLPIPDGPTTISSGSCWRTATISATARSRPKKSSASACSNASSRGTGCGSERTSTPERPAPRTRRGGRPSTRQPRLPLAEGRDRWPGRRRRTPEPSPRSRGPSRGGGSAKHVLHQHPQRVDVGCRRRQCATEALRCVIGAAGERDHSRADLVDAEIRQVGVILFVEEHVLRSDPSVRHPMAMR